MRSTRFARLSIPSLLLVGVLLGGMLGACGGDTTGGELEVVEPQLVQTQQGTRVFTGILVNHRSSALNIAQVEVALYDAEGVLLETMQINVEDVAAGDSVEFKQTIDSDRPIEQAQVQSVFVP